MRRVSRNAVYLNRRRAETGVTPRMRRVSRNLQRFSFRGQSRVTPRMRRVSRNCGEEYEMILTTSHASHEACE